MRSLRRLLGLFVLCALGLRFLADLLAPLVPLLIVAWAVVTVTVVVVLGRSG